MLDWWNSQNTKKRHLWIGLSTARIGSTPENTAQEIVNQIELVRKVEGKTAGTIHFNFNSIAKNKGDIQKYFRENLYAENALIPESNWIKSSKPSSPIVRKNLRKIFWRKRGNSSVFWWILYRKNEKGWNYEILPAGENSYQLTAQNKNDKFAVAAVDRLGNQSKPAFR